MVEKQSKKDSKGKGVYSKCMKKDSKRDEMDLKRYKRQKKCFGKNLQFHKCQGHDMATDTRQKIY